MEEHPCPIVISKKLQSNFIEITFWHGFSPVNLLYILRTPFPKSTYGRLLLKGNISDGNVSNELSKDLFIEM